MGSTFCKSAQDKGFRRTILEYIKRFDFFKSFSFADASIKPIWHLEDNNPIYQWLTSLVKGGGTVVPEGLPSPEFVNSALSQRERALLNPSLLQHFNFSTIHPFNITTPFTHHPSRFTSKKAVIRIIRDVGKAWFPDTLRAGFAIAHTAPYRKSASPPVLINKAKDTI